MNAVRTRHTVIIYGAGIDDEPPLTEDEIRGIEVADREIEEGKAIPFSDVFKDL